MADVTFETLLLTLELSKSRMVIFLPTITCFVMLLQMKQPFGAVSMDFSRSRTIREKRARGFRISFHVDLDKSWDVTKSITVVGDEQ